MPMNQRLLRPRQTGFNPRSISGLALWLDAADASTITRDQGVSAWRDKSGSGGGTKQFAQITGNNQPATGSATMNGRNVIVFDGVDDFMTATDPFMTGVAGGLPVSMFVVQRIVSATNFGMTYTTGGGFELRQNSTTGQVQVNADAATTIHTFSSSTVGVNDILSLVFPSGATNNLFWQRGTAQTLSGTASAKPATTTATHTIGRRTGGALAASVWIAEILAYQSQLSDSQRQLVQRYLGSKWGITVA